MDDDFELEVTNLDTGTTTRHRLADDAPGAPNRPQGSGSGGGPDADQETDGIVFEQQRPPRQRSRTRAVIVSGIVLLGVLLVLVVNPTAKSSLSMALGFPTPTPTPTPLPGSDRIYLFRGAPWGTVTLDGKQSSDANLGFSFMWIRLTPGRHTISVSEPPFPALHCTVSSPASPRDTCPQVSLENGPTPELGDGLNFPVGSRALDLGARVDRLPRDARTALIAAVDEALKLPSAPAILQPGDHYLNDSGIITTARTTLRATFVPTLLTPPDAYASADPDCASFCDITGMGWGGGGGAWEMRVAARASWHITSADGTTVAKNAPMIPSDPIFGNQSSLLQATMSVLWSGTTWQVSAQTDYNAGFNADCQEAQEMFDAMLAANGNVSITGSGMVGSVAAGQGCALGMMLSNPSASDPLNLLYRLGVLTTINAVAHQTFPTLPVASAHEKALALQILAGT